MDIDQRINELAHEVGKYIRAQAIAAGMSSDVPVSIQGHMEIAMRRLAGEIMANERKRCAMLAESYKNAQFTGNDTWAEGFAFAKRMIARNIRDLTTL